MRLLKLTRLICLSLGILVVISERDANAEFSLTATAQTNTVQDSGAIATAVATYYVPESQFAGASIFGNLNFESLFGGDVVADDEPDVGGNFGALARIHGTWADTIRWTGMNPAPSSLFVTVKLTGSIMAAPKERPDGRLGEASAAVFVGVQDNVAQREVGIVSFGTSESLFGDFSRLGRFELSKAVNSDEYWLGFRFEANARANVGFVRLDVSNTFGFVDITLEDGTSVRDQISFDSGLDPNAVSTIPEPTSMALFGMGMLGAGVVVRRRIRER